MLKTRLDEHPQTSSNPLKNHSKIKENGFRAQNFPRLRRAERGFAFGAVLLTPKSATLTVTIIPVSPEGGAPSQGRYITDDGVAALAAGCTQLTSLNLFACDEITDATVAGLPERILVHSRTSRAS